MRDQEVAHTRVLHCTAVVGARRKGDKDQERERESRDLTGHASSVSKLHVSGAWLAGEEWRLSLQVTLQS